MRTEALLFDCGGVVVAPATWDWMLPPESLEVLGEGFLSRMPEFRRAKRAAGHLLPDGIRMCTDAAEYEQLKLYYDRIFRGEMGLALADGQIERIARAQAFGNERYYFFEDVLPFFEKWRGAYKLGYVSDAPPSLGRILALKGYMKPMSACALSCEVGAMKPHPEMYMAALRALDVPPEAALYVDDLPDKLEGAKKLGIRCVQMVRRMPEGFVAAPAWDGERVASFEELDAIL